MHFSHIIYIKHYQSCYYIYISKLINIYIYIYICIRERKSISYFAGDSYALSILNILKSGFIREGYNRNQERGL